MTREKDVLTECLQLYKEFTCLWDSSQVLYTNKIARDKAYEVLLETYRQMDKNATIKDIKKKIDNMRTTYRRERKKILLSRLNEEEDEYVPKLWYYHLMTFLNDSCDFNILESSSLSPAEDEMPEPVPKKRKSPTEMYLPEYIDSNEEDAEDDLPIKRPLKKSYISLQTEKFEPSAAEIFGTYIGLQLKELDTMQRTIAEKNISDIIYYARQNMLTNSTSINLNAKFSSSEVQTI